MNEPGTGTKKETAEWISMIQLKQIMPNAPAKQLTIFYTEFNRQLPLYQITKPLRIAAYIAQGAHESGELHELTENMNYSAPRIMQVWPSRFHTLEAAQPYAHQPEKLGNNVYANRMGNGAPETGDGYNYRGRGWFNGTGKGFYRKITLLTHVDFLVNPDLLSTARFAVLSACEEWKSDNLNSYADAGNIREITHRINGGYIGLSERIRYYNKAKKAFGIMT